MRKTCDRSPPARPVRFLAVVAGATLLLGVAPLAHAASDYGSVEIRYRGDGADGASYDWISIQCDADRDPLTGVGGYEVNVTQPWAKAGEDPFQAGETSLLEGDAEGWFSPGGKSRPTA